MWCDVACVGALRCRVHCPLSTVNCQHHTLHKDTANSSLLKADESITVIPLFSLLSIPIHRDEQFVPKRIHHTTRL